MNFLQGVNRSAFSKAGIINSGTVAERLSGYQALAYCRLSWSSFTAMSAPRSQRTFSSVSHVRSVTKADLGAKRSTRIYARVFNQSLKRFSTMKSMNARTLEGILTRDDT